MGKEDGHLNNIKLYKNYAELIVSSPTHGQYKSLIDLDDVDKCNKFKWSVGKYSPPYDMYYMVTKGGAVLLHRFVMDNPKDMVIDHINGDTMDNRKENLRICTMQQNSMNRKMSVKNKSGYKGVTKHKPTGKWMAYIMIDYKFKNLGYFSDIEEAAKVRQVAEEKYFGEYKSMRED